MFIRIAIRDISSKNDVNPHRFTLYVVVGAKQLCQLIFAEIFQMLKCLMLLLGYSYILFTKDANNFIFVRLIGDSQEKSHASEKT